MYKRRRLIAWVLVAFVSISAIVGSFYVAKHSPNVSGFVADELRPVDAVVVLGPLDERLPSGLRVLESGVSDTLIVSTPRGSFKHDVEANEALLAALCEGQTTFGTEADPGEHYLADLVDINTQTLLGEMLTRFDPATRVFCFAPEPSTTLGEALGSAEYAALQDLKSLGVVTNNYHGYRTAWIFETCLPETEIAMFTFEGSMNPFKWIYRFTYEAFAWLKAQAQVPNFC